MCYDANATLDQVLNDNIFSVIGDEFLDHDDVFSCFSLDKLVGVGINPLSLLINRLWHCAGIDYQLFLYDKECGKGIMRETQRYQTCLFSVLEHLSHTFTFSQGLKYNNFAYVILAVPYFCFHNKYHLRFKTKKFSVFANC